MRLVPALVCLLLVGCSGPHSDGGLWAQQNIERELDIGRMTNAVLADRAHAYELTLADASLAAERTRISAMLQDCPGAARQALALSPGDGVRDTIRLRVAGDAQRQASVAQLALADWRVRRARATAQAHFCAEAQQALSGSATSQPSSADVLAGLGSATVSRAPGHAAQVAEQTSADFGLSLSDYALGAVDSVRAPAPLPQYLAAVYGGVVVAADGPPALSGQSPEDLVDRLAPGYPEWEPDAIYAALRAG